MLLDIDAARTLAGRLFRDDEDRWLHAQACVRRAEEIAPVVGRLDRSLLVCAAWLHDIGQAPDLVSTGFHPIDGADHLTAAGWSPRLAALVAHHCEARVTAAARGLAGELARFAREDGPVADALVHADMVSGRRGERVSMARRLAELDARPGPQAATDKQTATDKQSATDGQAGLERRRLLIEAVGRTERRMCGLHRAAAVG